MSVLFSPAKIRSLELKNRFVRSATFDGYAEKNGDPTETQLDLYEALAKGGIGLIVLGITYVHRSGRISPNQNALDRDDCIPGQRRLVDRVHAQGAGIAVQLFHGGREIGRFNPDRAVGPYVVENDPWFKGGYRAMTGDQVREVIGAFGDAAWRAKEAGFDAVQIHGAHAYLISQFLSPFANRREDEWGGSLENRLRIHREIYRDIRAKVGPGYPILIKIGVKDGFPGGLTLEEGLDAAVSLAEEGYDALEISSGLRGEKWDGTEVWTGVDKPGRGAYFRSWAADVKARISVPVMMVGGLRTVSLMEEAISSGEADFVSLSRPLVRQPDIIEKWEKDPAYKPTCISCNQCFELIHTGAGLECVVEKRKAAKEAAGEGGI